MVKSNLTSVTPKLQSLVKPIPKKKKSKVFKVVFAVVLAIFSLDFGFIKFRRSRINVLIKFLCALQTVIENFFVIYFNTYENLIFIAWFSTNIIEHCLLVFVLLFANKFTFCKFYSGLSFIDNELGIAPTLKPELIIISCVGVAFSYRCIVQIMLCMSLSNYCSLYTNILFLVPVLSADVFIMVYFTIYYLLYNRLRALTTFVSQDYCDIVACQSLYKFIAGIADSIKPVYNSLYLGILIVHTIDMMITVFYPLLTNDLPMPANFTLFIQKAFTVFSPAFAAGLLSSESDRLRVVLQDKLFKERDSTKQILDIKRFARYIEVRPLKTTIWKVVPLDWQLPVMIINLTVTYLIVILQFSHKY